MKNIPGNFLAGLGLLLIMVVSFSFIQNETSKMGDDQETRVVDAYDKVVVSGHFDVEVRLGDLKPVQLKGDHLDQVKLEVKNGTLYISSEKSNHGKIEVGLTVSDLYAVQIAGSGHLHSTDAIGGKQSLHLSVGGSGHIDTKVDAGDLKAEISGSGKITCGGNATSTDISIAGSGHFDGKDVNSPKAAASIAGSGKAELFASQEARADISGSGSVHMYGNPKKLKKSVSGSGQVKKMD